MKALTQVTSLYQAKRHVWLVVGLGAAALGVVAIAVFAGIFFDLPYARTGRQAAEIQKQLEVEFNDLAPMPGAIQVRYASVNKTHQGEVGADYKTGRSYSEIREYYRRELEGHGWKLAKEEVVKIWGRDLGGKQLYYCKGKFTATVQYAGEEETKVGWTYSFGLSWGLFDECE